MKAISSAVGGPARASSTAGFVRGRLLVRLLAWWLAGLAGAHAAGHPNIIFILCDDLGYGDVGVFFQNLRAAQNNRAEPWHFTPHLDTFAAEGLQLPHQYCPAPVCAPSRASLLLGVHQGHANVRDNQFDKALDDNHTLGTVLQQAGYKTACIGKWGLQGSGSSPATWPAYPLNRGFDFYFGYVRHDDGHEHYPKEGPYQGAKEVWDNQTEISAQLDKCYTADLFTARAKKWIVDQHTAQPSQPFFLYLAYDTPHATIELPTIAYPAGGGLSGGLQWTGTPGAMINTATGTVDSYLHPDYASATYDSDHNAGTPEVAWPNVDKRYATSVRRLDDAVGDLIQTLKDLNIDHDTLVVFTTDNGVSNESYLSQAFTPDFFNSFGPFDGIKRDCWEGGIRVGALVRWPGGVPAGRVDNLPCTFADWMPTFAELAGVPPPARSDGVSLVPTLENLPGQKTPLVYIEYDYPGTTPAYADFDPSHRGRTRNQMQVLRLGDYVGVRYDIASHADPFEIYNIVSDPEETSNLAASLPVLQQQMKDTVLRVRRPGGGASRPYDAELVPPLASGSTVAGVDWRAYAQSAPWVPEWTNFQPATSGSTATPTVNVRPRDQDIGLLFTGYLVVPADGSYTFSLTADTRAFLRIHEAQVIDADYGYAGGTERSGTIALRAGKHPFRLSYARGSAGTPALSLQWSGPGIARQDVPAANYARDGVSGPTPPTATDDSATTLQNTVVNVPVLANDTDDGTPQPLSISNVGLPRAGTAVVNGSQITYTPAAGFLGEDQFSYTITDGAATASATVRVTVAYADNDYWFPFNQLSGLTTLEAGGYRSATLNAFTNDPAQWMAGRFDRALNFDGVDDSVSVDHFTGLTGTAARTCAAWVKTTGTGQLPVIAWGANVAGSKWTFLIQGGQPRLEVTSGWVQATRMVNDGQWHHIACTFSNDGSPDATDVQLYIDGTKETTFSTSHTQTINTSATTVKIGSDVQSRFYVGALDDARIYARALSAAEIAALYSDPQTTAEAWHRRYFGAAAVDWNADDDHDGLSRLAEYALGRQPHLPDATALLAPEITSGRLRASFARRRAGTHSLTYTVQASTDLHDWTTLVPSEIGSVARDSEFDTATFEAPATASAPCLFLRLRVTLP